MGLFRKKQKPQSVKLLYELVQELKAGPRSRWDLVSLFEHHGRADVAIAIERLKNERLVEERPFGPNESPSQGSWWLHYVGPGHPANLAV
jgi:hypothetical protein